MSARGWRNDRRESYLAALVSAADRPVLTTNEARAKLNYPPINVQLYHEPIRPWARLIAWLLTSFIVYRTVRQRERKQP